MEEEFGEYAPPLAGEGAGPVPGEGGSPFYVPPPVGPFIVPFDIPIVEKKLTFEEASKCLNMLGKDASGVRYAYLMITATDRKLTNVDVIPNFKHVMFLDLSGNFLNLEALQVLSNLPFLVMLRAARNRLESAALAPMPFLQVLSVNVNKIQETNDIGQPMLDTLQMEFNQLFTAQFDSEKLPCLKELDLKGNHLMDLSGDYPESLEKLFLSQNQIMRIDDVALSKMRNLTTLMLRDNRIRKLDGFGDFLVQLTYLNLRGNDINKVRQFRKLAMLPRLETLIYTDNPLDRKAVAKQTALMGEEALGEQSEMGEAGEGGPVDEGKTVDQNRLGILVLLPGLKRINKEMVTLQERDAVFLVKDRKLEEIMGEMSSEDETEPPTTDYTSPGESETEGEDTMTPKSVPFGEEEV